MRSRRPLEVTRFTSENRGAPGDCIARFNTRRMPSLKFPAVRREPSLKRSPRLTVNTYVRPSDETSGGPVAASGRTVDPSGAGASRNAIKVAQVAYHSGPQPSTGSELRAGSTVTIVSAGTTTRRVRALDVAVAAGQPIPSTHAIPRTVRPPRGLFRGRPDAVVGRAEPSGAICLYPPRVLIPPIDRRVEASEPMWHL